MKMSTGNWAFGPKACEKSLDWCHGCQSLIGSLRRGEHHPGRIWWECWSAFQKESTQICTSFLDLHLFLCCCCRVTELCPALCDPVNCSPPGSCVQGISQARVLEWVAVSSSRGSSWPRDQTRVSCIGRRVLDLCATWEAMFSCDPH